MEIDQRLRQKIANYKPDPAAILSIADVPLVFLVGITGAGKDSLQAEVLRRYPDTYKFIVSHTTRPPRSNNGVMERDGVDYHYIDFATAERMLDAGAYVEANIVYYKNIYGTAIAEIQEIQKQGKIAMSDIEVQGVHQYVDLGLNVRPIFIIPPSFDVWWKRFQGRYEGKIEWPDAFSRMRAALDELECAQDNDYYNIVINDNFDDTVELINRIGKGQSRERSESALAVLDRLATDMAAHLKAWRSKHPV